MARDIQIHIRALGSLEDFAAALSKRFNVTATKECNRLDVDSRFETDFVLSLVCYAHPDAPFDNEDLVGGMAVFSLVC